MKKSWDKKWYTDEFLQELKATKRTVTDGNLKIIEKYAPDAKSDIAVDPRLLGGPLGRNAKMMALLPGFIVNRMRMNIHGMKRFVKCFFELLTQNFSVRQKTGQEKGCKTHLWTVRSRFRG